MKLPDLYSDQVITRELVCDFCRGTVAVIDHPDSVEVKCLRCGFMDVTWKEDEDEE